MKLIELFKKGRLRKTRREDFCIHFPLISLFPHKREISTEKKNAKITLLTFFTYKILVG